LPKIFLIFSRKFQKESNVYPVGIMLLAAVLREKGFKDIRLFDLAFHSKEYIVKQAQEDSPDIIGLSTDSISFENGIDLFKKIQEAYKGATYIAGGVHPTIAPEESLLKLNAEVAVIGEGERTIVEVIEAIAKKKEYSGISGIAYLKDGQFVQNEPREFIENLDELPFPSRDLLPMEKYLGTAADIPMLSPTITVFASRGCKGNCIYCQPVMRKLFGAKMRKRSVSNVIKEIIYLKENFSFNTLYFTDDELLYNGKEWIQDLCRTIIDKKLNLRWCCQARVDQIDEDLIKIMKESGCFAIGLGVESGSNEILRILRKGYKAEQVDKAFEICRRNKMITTCNFMIGTPGETKETLGESIDLLRRIRPNLVRCSITTPTPGSDLYTKLNEEGRINLSSLSDFDRWAVYPIKLENISKEDIQISMKSLLDVFYHNFFLNVVNPVRFVKEFYFFKVLMRRYFLLLKTPGVFFKDIGFYLNYFRHRKGCE